MTNSTRSFLPSVPSFLADTYGPGPHAGYYYFHSFPHVCLSACPSVRPPVHPFRSSFPRLSPLSGRAPSPTPRKSLFGCFRGLPLKRASSLPPRTRDGALSFLRATRDGKSSRPPLSLGRYSPAFYGILVGKLCENRKWNTYIIIIRRDILRNS